MSNGTDSTDKCPNCGCTSFATVNRPDVDPQSLRAGAIQKHRDKLNETRGPLQECQCCHYVRRAKDKLEPAAGARA
jgi:hypothetical protein